MNPIFCTYFAGESYTVQIIHVVVPDGGDAEVKKIELYLKKLLRSLDVIISQEIT